MRFEGFREIGSNIHCQHETKLRDCREYDLIKTSQIGRIRPSIVHTITSFFEKCVKMGSGGKMNVKLCRDMGFYIYGLVIQLETMLRRLYY